MEELEDVGEEPLEGSRDGVKLGESTLKRFLLALLRFLELISRRPLEADRLSSGMLTCPIDLGCSYADRG